MSNELLNRLEEKINTAIETIELSRMEISELKEQNEELAIQQGEWEERLTVLIEKFEQLENSDESISASEEETSEDTYESEDAEDNEQSESESEGSTFGTEQNSYDSDHSPYA